MANRASRDVLRAYAARCIYYVDVSLIRDFAVSMIGLVSLDQTVPSASRFAK